MQHLHYKEALYNGKIEAYPLWEKRNAIHTANKYDWLLRKYLD
jgi:hypothetical protein